MSAEDFEDIEVGEEEEVEDSTLANSDVVTKYQEAAKIANAVGREIVNLCVAGANIIDVCKAGDKLILDKLAAIFRGKGKDGRPVEKGIAFPVCLSVNQVLCHYSPMASDSSAAPLAEGDMVKMDLGVHIDGYIAVCAHTFVVGAPASISGRRAQVMQAAKTAADVVVRLLRPGNTNTMITEAVREVADCYGVQPVSGTLMHQMKRYIIDGNKMILLREENDQKVETCTFEPYEVYGVDIAMSTGEGKPKDSGLRTTVYKRIIDRKYALKSKTSRALLSEINKTFPTFPFSMRYINDDASTLLGLRECVNHELLLPYPILVEKAGDDVVHLKLTVLVMPNGTSRITGLDWSESIENSPVVPLSEKLLTILAEEEGSKKKKKKAKKAQEA